MGVPLNHPGRRRGAFDKSSAGGRLGLDSRVPIEIGYPKEKNRFILNISEPVIFEKPLKYVYVHIYIYIYICRYL